MKNELEVIYKNSLYVEKVRLRRQLTVVGAQIREIINQMTLVQRELMADPLYFEMAEGILDALDCALCKLNETEERLKEDLELCKYDPVPYELYQGVC